MVIGFVDAEFEIEGERVATEDGAGVIADDLINLHVNA
jgi:hypothetical protein